VPASLQAPDAARLAGGNGNADSAIVLRAASAHWLRHTMLTTHANNGVALKTLQDTARHASMATTSWYLHKSDRERHDALMACWRIRKTRMKARKRGNKFAAARTRIF